MNRNQISFPYCMQATVIYQLHNIINWFAADMKKQLALMTKHSL